ncbi:MAG: peptidase S41 [Ignavibacteria bacterium]|nr:MAG: peptidase S41 [Ignavibacteria bacterium]KAF0159094.1 MAG: peptidase S41 [Ignavibacteria bacterium]
MKRTVLLIFLISAQLIFAQENLLLRFPALNNNGSQIAFSFQGDIWTVPTAGGKAARLTIHEAYEANPKFSPDGKQIAFSGTRYGNNDLFVIPAEGGIPKRLTFHSAADNISSWANDGNILFSTNREFNQIERPMEIYSVSSKGGTEWRVLDAVGFEPIASPDGRFIAFVRGDINPVAREDYRGPSNRDIWLFDTKTKKYSKLVGFETNDVMPQWIDAKTIFFLSSNDGNYNIYKIIIDENGKAVSKPEQLTKFDDHSIRHLSVSGDGSAMIIERDKNIYISKTSKIDFKKVDVSISADDRFDPVEFKTMTNGLTEYAVSPNGKLIAFSVRGELFVKEADKDKNRSVNLSDSPFRDIDAAWLSDTTLVFASDSEDSNYELYLVKSEDKSQPNIFKSLKHELIRLTKTDEDETSPVISGDGKKIAYTRGKDKKQFVVANIDANGKLSNEIILIESWTAPSGVAWSPDNKWLAYSLDDLYFNEEVFIHAADNSSKPVNVSMHPRGDSNPFWSADGTKLGFLSSRSGQNAITGGLNFTRDVWFAWLKKEDWEKTKSDWDEKEPVKEPTASPEKPALAKDSKDEKSKDGNAKKEAQKVKPIQIDFENIHKRLVQVTNFPGDESNVVISKDGETFFYVGGSSTAKGGRDLYSVKWDGKDLKELSKGGSNPGSVTMDKDGKYLYYTKAGGSLTRHDIKGDKAELLPYSAKLKIDYPAERKQIFEEAWRAIRDGFYDPQFHGYNWNSLKKKYEELCLIASTPIDLRDMFNNMLGELNSSHMGFTAAERAETQRDATGLLGVELLPSKEGMKVLRVIPETPADKSNSKLAAEELITAVDGHSFESQNFYELLNNKVDEKILLTVKAKDGKEREIVIRPTNMLRQQLYQEWVNERRKLVEKFSGGRLGYIHIQGMDFVSFETFERELTAAGYGKEGLVIDVRYNGGGSTTDYLMTILNYKQHAYTIPRGASNNLERDKKKFSDYYPTGERLVFAAWMKPSIALCNEGSYSNAEIFSHAYKTLGIGKLVGVPTNGSVISTGGKGMVDGSFVRLPFRAWFTKGTDKNQELGPAVPDIIVENSVDWTAKGIDEQLKTACDELIKQIDSKQ